MSEPAVLHPDHGRGTVLELRATLLQQQEAGEPPHLMFVRWEEARGGVAGGWYNPMDERFTFENAAALASLLTT
jgi:hypothetical protein